MVLESVSDLPKEELVMQTTSISTSPLGQTGLEITRVGFGAWAIGGGGWEFGWAPSRTTSRSPPSTARSSWA